MLLSGGIQWTSGRERLALRRGDVVRYPTTAGSDTAWSEFELALVRIPMTAVEQAAQAHTGIGAGQLSFEGMAPVSPVMARQWRALFPLCAPVAGRA